MLALLSATRPAGPVGGLLVFDRMDIESFAEVGYDKAAVRADEKCTSSLEVTKRDGRYFALFSTTNNCYKGFSRLAKKRALVVNVPGTTTYHKFELADPRFVQTAAYWRTLDDAPRSMRNNAALEFSGLTASGNFSAYHRHHLKLSDTDRRAQTAMFCRIGSVKPTPENCMGPGYLQFDEVELIPASSQAALAEDLVAHTEATRNEARSQLRYVGNAQEVDALLAYGKNMAAIQPHLLVNDAAVWAAHAVYLCDANGDPNDRLACEDSTQAYGDAWIVKVLDIFSPEWKARLGPGLAKPASERTPFFRELDAERLETYIAPHFAPAFEAYKSIRKKFAAHPHLLGLATNYVDAAGKSPGLSFKTLTPAVAPGVTAAPELAGITITIDALGNVLMNHPGRDKNRNFTLDGHKSSVLTFAGIPLIPFDPMLIDESDATSRMPIPGTSARATRESGRNPPSSRPTNASETQRDGGC
jgi:hypothetical protein